MKQLGFNETLEQRDYGNFILLGQSYTEFDDETEEEKDIYNVSIEYIVDENYSQTLDLFESYDLEETEKYFNMIANNIEKVAGLKGQRMSNWEEELVLDLKQEVEQTDFDDVKDLDNSYQNIKNRIAEYFRKYEDMSIDVIVDLVNILNNTSKDLRESYFLMIDYLEEY